MNITINVIDHRDHDHQPGGKIIRPWVVSDYDAPGPRYADYCALYAAWHDLNPPDIIGFFGYRKYLAPIPLDHGEEWLKPAHAPHWWQCLKEDFDAYRQALADDKDIYGAAHISGKIKRLLAQYDILQAAPFPLTRSIFKDFAESRSFYDADVLNTQLPWKFQASKIYPYLFITRWSVFDRMMTELEPLRQKLDKLITAEDATDAAYKQRPMAYVMERVYSLWLENSGLSVNEMPLLHYWGM